MSSKKTLTCKLFWLLTCNLLLLPPVTIAQKITLVQGRTLEAYQQANEAFTKTTTHTITRFNMEGDRAKGATFLKTLNSENTDLTVLIGTEAVGAANEISFSLPYLYTMVYEPPSLTGQQVAGVIMQIPLEIQISKIKKMFPNKKHIGVIYSQGSADLVSEKLGPITKAAGMELHALKAENLSEVYKNFNVIEAEHVEILLAIMDKLISQPQIMSEMIAFSKQGKIILVGYSLTHVKGGALAAVTLDFSDLGIQTSELADKVLKNESSGKAEFPRHVKIYVNRSVMNQLGLDEFPALPDINYIP
jgi:putative tryptophan/tyrosine transport system substrate-binding protein